MYPTTYKRNRKWKNFNPTPNVFNIFKEIKENNIE